MIASSVVFGRNIVIALWIGILLQLFITSYGSSGNITSHSQVLTSSTVPQKLLQSVPRYLVKVVEDSEEVRMFWGTSRTRPIHVGLPGRVLADENSLGNHENVPQSRFNVIGTHGNDGNHPVCGAMEIPKEFRHMYQRHRKQRHRRSSKDQRLIEIYAIMDKALFTGSTIGSDQGKAEQYVVDAIHNVDKWFSWDLGIRVVLVGLELWASNKIPVSTDPKELLTQLLRYPNANTTATAYDVIALISGLDFTGTLAGMAYVGVMCGPLSGLVVQHFPGDPNPVLKTSVLLAHELGHVIGLTHDTSSCGPTGSKIMAADISAKPTTFSACSKTELQNIIGGGQGHCLYNLPEVEYKGPVCGNGIREKGEVCDCGDVVGCSKDPCCRYPCMLRPGAQCGVGGCCSSCKIAKAGTECRKAQTPCDIAEYCNGRQQECPANNYKADMTSCTTVGATGNCYRGKCRSNHAQCEHVWGAGRSLPGDFVCYRENAKGDSLGNCGSLKTGVYQKCSSSDIMCGTLQCDTNATYPVLGERQVIALKTTSIRGKTYHCKAATIDLGADVPDPGLVEDGSPCYDVISKTNGVCHKKRCIKMAAFPTVVCSADAGGTPCSGNGVCNQLGTCVCQNGFSGLNCGFNYTTTWAPPTVTRTAPPSVTQTAPPSVTKTAPPSSTRAPQKESQGLPVWAIVLIAVGSLALVAIATFTTVCCCVMAAKRRNRVHSISLNHTTVVQTNINVTVTSTPGTTMSKSRPNLHTKQPQKTQSTKRPFPRP